MAKPFRSLRSKLNGTYRKKERDALQRQLSAISALREALSRSGVHDAGIAAIPDRLERFVKAEMRFIKTALVLGSPATRFLMKATGATTASLLQPWRDDAREAYDFRGAKLPLPVNAEDDALYGLFMDEIIVPYILNSFRVYDDGPYQSHDGVCLCENDVVFDCGANMGFFSAVAAATGCSVYAFEPSNHIRTTYLEKTAALNKRITVCPYAVADSPGTMEFLINLDYLGSSRIDNGDRREKSESRIAKETVDAIRLDDFVESRGIARVDFIKADIEGAERKMLAGATGILKRFAPKLAICTYHLPDDPDVLKSIILDAQPKYVVRQGEDKLYAHVP